nr:MAG TPA: Protein of unknown function (DUF1515) [Caudoviricetes sp.]
MTWEILSALIVIVGTLISLGTVLAKLIRVLTRLDDTVKQLRADLDRQREENRESHKRIYDRLDDHESRIVELERGEK